MQLLSYELSILGLCIMSGSSLRAWATLVCSRGLARVRFLVPTVLLLAEQAGEKRLTLGGRWPV